MQRKGAAAVSPSAPKAATPQPAAQQPAPQKQEQNAPQRVGA